MIRRHLPIALHARKKADRSGAFASLKAANPARSLENQHIHRALGLTGMTAPMALNGPMTKEWLPAYSQQVLAPTLPPADIVILDKLPAHKTMVGREPLKQLGVYAVPADIQPRLQSNRKRLLKLKAILRKAAARTVPELQDAIREALPRLTPEECAN